MSEQSEINTEAAQIQTEVTNLQVDDSAIQAEIAALQAANPTLDFTPLTAAIGNLVTQVGVTSAIPPAAPVQAFDPGTNLPLYSYAGTAPVQSPPWTQVSDVTGPNGEALYTFANDTSGQPPTGAAPGQWVPFTGTTTPA